MLLLVASIATLAPCAAHGQCAGVEESAELFGGGAWNAALPITVERAGERVRFRAQYTTRPFQDAPYYSYRVGRTSVGRGAELEMLHHKLYLENPRPPVEWLEVSHGYNQPMASLVTPWNGWRWRIGIGLVVAHPEGRIGGRPVGPLHTLLGGGYHVAGVSTQLALGRRYALGQGDVALTAAPEVKLTAALARIRVDGGSITVPNLAAHALGGLGVRRCR